MFKSELVARIKQAERAITYGQAAQARHQLTLLIKDLSDDTSRRRPHVVCSNCGEIATHMANNLCAACYQYKWRTGKDRPDFRRTRYCRGCRLNRKHHGRGFCHSCYMKRHRAGTLAY
jgi:thymidylate synthase